MAWRAVFNFLLGFPLGRSRIATDNCLEARTLGQGHPKANAKAHACLMTCGVRVERVIAAFLKGKQNTLAIRSKENARIAPDVTDRPGSPRAIGPKSADRPTVAHFQQFGEY